jgi:hypothetical protein
MIRRRRRERDIAFGFDSFLDVVANVVGIIIRLILVVWVGARAYSQLPLRPRPAEPAAEVVAESTEPEDPLHQELAEQRRQLAEAQALLLARLKDLESTQQEQARVEKELADLSLRLQALDRERDAVRQSGTEKGKAALAAALSLAEIRRRSQQLTEEIRALEKLPPAKQTLPYRTPVSRPVHGEELLFECRRGRVTFLDIAALREEVLRSLPDKKEQLRSNWQVTDVAGPVGAFRLRYTVERDRDGLRSLVGGGVPNRMASFSYGLTTCEVEPLDPNRGEPVEAALATGSQFRGLVDRLDPQYTAVTLCVYPDSFALYRRLRDYLYDRGLEVAGRVLPEGQPIGFSRDGSVSRGQ